MSSSSMSSTSSSSRACSTRSLTKLTMKALAFLNLIGAVENFVSADEKVQKGFTSRLIQIPDVHGDYDMMQKAISLIQPPLTKHDRLVFTGDLVDRGPDPQKCYDLSEELTQKQAEFEKEGSPGESIYRVTKLMGNHEWVTLQGVDQYALFAQYVSAGDLNSFGGWGPRQAAFSSGGKYGKMIREGWDVIALEEIPGEPKTRTLFVHAGLRFSTLKRHGSVDAMRKEGKQSMLSDRMQTALLNEILQTRHQAEGPDSSVCSEINNILEFIGASRLVVGHTPTPLIGGQPGQPVVRCGGRYILMDVAMSKWMGGGVPAILIQEVEDNVLKRVFIKYGHDGKEKDLDVVDHLGVVPVGGGKDEL